MWIIYIIIAYLIIHCDCQNTNGENSGNVNPNYLNFVKKTLADNDDFDLYPDSVRCTEIDPDKQMVWWFNKQNSERVGIRACDLCPK